MKFLYKLERKFGKYAIKNLSLIIVLCFGMGYILNIFAPTIYGKLTFSPYDIFCKYEVWRIFTWIFTIPGQFNFFTLVMLFFYYSIGSSMERSLGTFLYNIYVLGGMLITTISCLIVGVYAYISGGASELYVMTLSLTIADNMGIGITSAMLQSIFFGFALIYGEAMVMVWFIIPLKVKYLAWLNLLLLAYDFINWPFLIVRVSIVASIANFIIFYFVYKKYKSNRLGAFAQLRRKKQMKNFKVLRNDDFINKKEEISSVTRHKCAICGKSEKDDPNLEFRFCSKCNGNYEYCSEHLYTHTHVE